MATEAPPRSRAIEQIQVIDLPTPRRGAVQSLAWAPNSGWLGMTSFQPPPNSEGMTDDGQVSIVTPTFGELRELSAAPVVSMNGLAWLGDSRYLAVLEPGQVRLIEVESNTTSVALDIQHETTLGLASHGGVLAAVVRRSHESVIKLANPAVMSHFEDKLSWPAEDGLIACVGWSPDGRYLAGLVIERPLARLVIWQDERVVSELDLGMAFVPRPVLSDSWSSDSRRIAVAIQPLIERAGKLHLDELTRLMVWDVEDNSQQEYQFDLGAFGVFGAVWAGRDMISATTGEDILLIQAGPPVAVVRRLDSFYSGSEPEPPDSDEAEAIISSQGFTVRHSWAPNSHWLAAGNVGGLRLWEMQDSSL